MRAAIFTGAKSVDADVAGFMNKVALCKEFGWTPEEYGRQKWSDIRMFGNWLKWRNAKLSSLRENG